MPRLADLDAVTLDANGTLITLADPVPSLIRLLRARGLDRTPDSVRRAFEAEGKVYAARAVEAHQTATFAALQRECTSVFLDEVGGGTVDPDEFAPEYVGAMQFELVPGIPEALAHFRRRGLELAVVANFDLTLARRLEELGLAAAFSAVVTPADAGCAKPDPAIFELALSRLRVSPQRALHIGDGAWDEEGARAAGMHFAWAPVAEVLEAWR